MKKLIILAIPILFLACSDSSHITNVEIVHPEECCPDTTIVEDSCKGHTHGHRHETGNGKGHCHE